MILFVQIHDFLGVKTHEFSLTSRWPLGSCFQKTVPKREFLFSHAAKPKAGRLTPMSVNSGFLIMIYFHGGGKNPAAGSPVWPRLTGPPSMSPGGDWGSPCFAIDLRSLLALRLRCIHIQKGLRVRSTSPGFGCRIRTEPASEPNPNPGKVIRTESGRGGAQPEPNPVPGC